jgi:DNA-binding PadR family transcriptional regulator
MSSRLFRHGELPLVLLSLLHRQPCHGYQLLAELTRLFGARYSASPGSVYPALESLEKQGLLVAATEVGGRRVYSTSQAGASALVSRRADLVALEARVGVRLLGGDVVDEALDRLSAAVRDSRDLLDPDLLARLLDGTTDRLRSASGGSATLTNNGETR